MSNSKVPEDFFEHLPDRIMGRIEAQSIKDELLTYCKVLAAIPKDNPYKVPQGYFERLAKRKIVNPQVFKLWTGIASVAATIIIMGLIIIGHDAESDEVISDEDIFAYYEDNAEEIEPYMLSELLIENEEVSLDDIILEEIISDLSDEELELLNQTL